MKIVMRPIMLAALMMLSSFVNADENISTVDLGDVDNLTARFLFSHAKFDKRKSINQSGPGDTDGSDSCSDPNACLCSADAGCSVRQLTEFCRVCRKPSIFDLGTLEIDDRFKGPVVFKYLEEAQANIVVKSDTLATDVSFPKLVETEFSVIVGAQGNICPVSLSSLDFPELEVVRDDFVIGQSSGCTGLKRVNAPMLSVGPNGDSTNCNTGIGGTGSLLGCSIDIRNNPNLEYVRLKASSGILREGDNAFKVDVRFGNNGDAILIGV